MVCHSMDAQKKKKKKKIQIYKVHYQQNDSFSEGYVCEIIEPSK